MVNILFEKGLNQDQKVEAVASYLQEKRNKDEGLKSRYPETFQLCKEWVEANRVDISKQLKKSITG